MSVFILDGKWLSGQVLASVTREVAALSTKIPRAPGLAVILVGDNPASKAYVQNKGKAARKCGFNAFDLHLPADAGFAKVSEAVEVFNRNSEVDGILVQLPLPGGIDSAKIIELINPAKDADGLHPLNQGLLMAGKGKLRPCTPAGVMKLIDLACEGPAAVSDRFNLKELPRADLSGRTAVVVGRSVLVGKPLSLMLLERNATVIMAHSRSADAAALCRQADIVVAATGKAGLVRENWVRKGAIVIDVGINRIESGPRAGKLTGDVDYERVAPLCSAITPVPGGVGPMTVAMLIHNTLESYRMCHS